MSEHQAESPVRNGSLSNLSKNYIFSEHFFVMKNEKHKKMKIIGISFLHFFLDLQTRLKNLAIIILTNNDRIEFSNIINHCVLHICITK